MSDNLLATQDDGSVAIWTLEPRELDDLPDAMPANIRRWIEVTGFRAKPGETTLVADETGDICAVVFGLGDGEANPEKSGAAARMAMGVGKLARLLPKGSYHLVGGLLNADQAALGWVLGGYSYDRYLSKNRIDPLKQPRLAMPAGTDLNETQRIASAVYLVRDLVNTPANDLGPVQLESAFRKLAESYSADVQVVEGEALLEKNFPMIHAVGRASIDAPRLLELNWGNSNNPKVTLVGKGVSFDTGGLNIKPGSSMGLMKKDMGGAANALGLASMIMDAKLPVCLRLLIPSVENAISGNAFRPGDILPSRKGISVEIGNTDAEGRLILADALTYADEETPELLVDLATLTGAARVALGPDLPPFYTDDDAFADSLSKAGTRLNDPLWRMPLWPPYDKMLASSIADVNHISTGGFAGSITAAMFLARFVENAKIWAHFDIFSWVPTQKPWAPVGGEAQAIRTLYDVIKAKYPA